MSLKSTKYIKLETPKAINEVKKNKRLVYKCGEKWQLQLHCKALSIRARSQSSKIPKKIIINK